MGDGLANSGIPTYKDKVTALNAVDNGAGTLASNKCYKSTNGNLYKTDSTTTECCLNIKIGDEY